MRLAAAVLLAALAAPVAAQEQGDQWRCGPSAPTEQRALCALLAPVVLAWPVVAVVAKSAGDALEAACGEPLAPGWTVEDTGTTPAYPGQWWYPCAVERPAPQS